MVPSAEDSILQSNVNQQMALHELTGLIGSVDEGLVSAGMISTASTHRIPRVVTEYEERNTTVLTSVLNPLKHFVIGADEVSFLPPRDVPLTEATIVMAHNAYNMPGTGITSIMPNQNLSIPQLLKSGVRAFELDTYVNEDKDLVLCHGFCNPTFSFFDTGWLFGHNTRLSEALGGISNFLRQNPREFVILKLEDYIRSDSDITNFVEIVKETFDVRSIFTPGDLSRLNGRWPTINELAAMGKKIVFMPQNLAQSKIDQLCDGLFFHTGFKDPTGLKVYHSAYEAQQTGFDLAEDRSKQFAEVGEDGTYAGWAISKLRKLPLVGGFLDKFLGKSGGVLTKKDVEKLKQKGGVVLGVDNISPGNDPRLSATSMIIGMLGKSYICIPLAIAAAALSPRKEAVGFIPKAMRLAIQTLIASVLSAGCSFLYRTVDETISEFNEENSEKIAKKLDRSIFRILGASLYKGLTNALLSTIKIRTGRVLGFVARKAIFGACPYLAIIDMFLGDVMIRGAKSLVTHPIDTTKSVINGFSWLSTGIMSVCSKMFHRKSLASSEAQPSSLPKIKPR